MSPARRRVRVILACSVAFAFALLAPIGAAGQQTAPQVGPQLGRVISFHTRLTALEEVPSILSVGVGTFEATLTSASSISYRLTYSGLTSPVLFAHIHLAQRPVNGAIVIFLCGGGGKPACPSAGTVTGTITPADVLPVPAQNVRAGDLTGVIAAMLTGYTYTNVHTSNFPAGEIRGYIEASR